MAESVEIVVNAVDNASGTINSIGSALGGLGAVAAGVAAAGLTAVATALGFLVTKGMESEDTMARFNALVGTSQLAGYKDQMLALADAYSKKTKFENDSIISAESTLAVYGNISQKVFPDVLKQTLNLAEFMKTDATTAAQTLGRAFSDIAGGSLTMLYRQKLLTEEQKKTAEQMAKTGDAAGAQAYVLGILNGKIGNLAETMGGTLSGRMAIFGNTLEQIAQDMGEKLLPVLEPLLKDLTDLALKIAPILTDALNKYLIPAFDNLVKTLDDLVTGKISFSDIFSAIGDFIKNIDWKKLSEDLAAGISSIDWSQVGTGLRVGVHFLGEQIIRFFQEVDWGALLASVFGGFGDMIAGFLKPGATFQNSVVEPWKRAFEQIGQALSTTKNIWESNFRQMTEIVTKAGSLIVNAILGWLVDIDTALRTIAKLFFNRAMGWVEQAILAVKGMTNALVEAIRNLVNAVQGAITGIVIPVTWGSPGPMPDYGHGEAGGGGHTATGGQRRRQMGGFVEGGEPVLIGEAGMEVFVPNQAGTIIPNHALGGGVNVTINISSMFSLADQRDAEQRLTPVIQRIFRNLRLTSV